LKGLPVRILGEAGVMLRTGSTAGHGLRVGGLSWVLGFEEAPLRRDV
jgi:hypothetical protein